MTGAAISSLVGLAVGMALGGAAGLAANPGPDIPKCAEDSVLLGVGDYDDGRWTQYRCAHPDVLS